MTNEQLKVLLEAYAARVRMEIENLRDQLPFDECERHQQYWHKEKNIQPVIAFLVENNEAYELRPTGDFVILDGLKNLLYELERAIEEL